MAARQGGEIRVVRVSNRVRKCHPPVATQNAGPGGVDYMIEVRGFDDPPHVEAGESALQGSSEPPLVSPAASGLGGPVRQEGAQHTRYEQFVRVDQPEDCPAVHQFSESAARLGGGGVPDHNERPFVIRESNFESINGVIGLASERGGSHGGTYRTGAGACRDRRGTG